LYFIPNEAAKIVKFNFRTSVGKADGEADEASGKPKGKKVGEIGVRDGCPLNCTIGRRVKIAVGTA
jgi:hypothetical protein